jgi:hypothetical protein
VARLVEVNIENGSRDLRCKQQLQRKPQARMILKNRRESADRESVMRRKSFDQDD